MIQYNPTVSGSLVVTGSLITTGNINGINLSTFSASINNALTESKVTHIVSASAGIYYIDGTSKPSMSVVPGLTYRFETAIVDISHPFKFSTSQNGPIQYVNGVTSGSNFIQLEVNYDTPDVLYYYCTIHNNMGNAINVLKIDKLLTVVSSSFDSRYVISGSITQTTWDNIASKPAGIVSSSVQVLGGTGTVSGSSQLTASALATTGSNTFIGNQNISGTLYLTGSLIPSGSFVYDLGSETNSFRDLFISTGSIRFHNPDGTEQGRITVDARSGDISLLKTAGLTNEQKATISQGNINPTFLSAISASNLFVQTKIVMPAGGTVNGINLTAFSSSVSNTILNQNSATSSYETKGSGIVSGSSQITTLLPTGTISGSSQLNNASIENLTVINLTTVNETASVLFSSGSNRFGDFGNDIHDFTGSVKISGSFTLVGSSTATSYNGTINATNGVVSGSSQITYTNISSIPGGIVSGSSQTITNLPTGTVSGSSQVVSILSSVNTYTGSNDTLNSLQTTRIDQLAAGTASVNSFTASNGNTSLNSYTASNDTTNTAQSARLTTIESVTGSYETKGRSIVSGSSQITYTGISSIPGGIVSGSSQITYTNVSSIPAGIVSGSSQITYANISSIPNGIVSGSSQITLSSTTGYGSVLNQAVLTTSSPTFAGVTMNGSIGKTHDLMSEGTFGYSATYKTLKLGSTSASNPQSIAFGVDLSGNAGSSFSGYGTEYYFRNVGSFKTPNSANNEYNTLFGWNSSGQITFNQNATFSGTITGNASTATSAATLTTARTINGTSFNGSADITIANLVSGSAQVSLASTTGFGTYINQAVLTTSSPTFAAVSATTFTGALSGNATTVTNGVYTSGDQSISGVKTFAVIKGDSGAAYPHSFTNTHAGNTHWTNRSGRLLTSNGSNWAADGKDPIMALVGSTASTVRGQMIGLALHNENNTTNAFSPIIAFSALSNSSGYNSMYASIMGKKTGTGSGLDTNWNKGELHFYAHGDSYVADTPNLLLSGTAATFSGTITESSSLRYKENVKTIKYGLDKVLQMRGVTYNKKDNGVKEIGVIAEEIYDVLPEVVLKNEEGEIDSVSYGRITAILIEAIKEQQKQIEELKALIK